MTINVALIALGCEKNVVNSEQMLFLLDQDPRITVVPDPDSADIVVINTCGFIEAARQEAIEQILEAGETGAKIIVAGCMAQRHGQDIVAEMPEVSGIVGAGRFDDIIAAVMDVAEGRPCLYLGELNAPVSETPRLITSPPYTAYLKIAEGCDNRCAYCAIPSLRGIYRSRPADAIVEEAKALLQSGVKEICLIAQDTTRYGLDTSGQLELPALLRRLCALEGLAWLRLHYLHPAMFTDELIDCIAAQDKIVKYLDVPVQHASDSILAAMNRRCTEQGLRDLFANLRQRIPGVVLRTTAMVGFPGETEEDFACLVRFLEDMHIERIGVFCFSPEEGTAAASLPDPVAPELAQRRQERIEIVASDLMDAYHNARLNAGETVLCEGFDRIAGLYFGRSHADAPEVDGKIFFRSANQHAPGDFVSVVFSENFEGDLLGDAEDTPAHNA